ncbi:MAG: ECF transporter S component [Clostridiales bacterium]|nr:ECF transporter S component [Clostridiales bacterium]
MMRNQHARWVAQTGIFLAVLVVAQIVTRPLGNSFVTGSLVNMLLILAVMFCGLSSAATIGAISPIIAALTGMSPFWPFVPVIIAGNLVIVFLWHIIALRRTERSKAFDILALAVGAGAKFLVLYIGIVNLIVPLVLNLAEPQAGVVSAAFSWPQIVTASIGGLLALLVSPVLAKAIPPAKS